jgi:hypothetical protein
MSYETWLRKGIRKGYCSVEFCDAHDIAPMSPSENAAWERGEDPCAWMVRLGPEGEWIWTEGPPEDTEQA